MLTHKISHFWQKTDNSYLLHEHRETFTGISKHNRPCFYPHKGLGAWVSHLCSTIKSSPFDLQLACSVTPQQPFHCLTMHFLEISTQHVWIPLSIVSFLSSSFLKPAECNVPKWSDLIKIPPPSLYHWSKNTHSICLADSGIALLWCPAHEPTSKKKKKKVATVMKDDEACFRKGICFFLTGVGLVLDEGWLMGFSQICYMQTYNQEALESNWFWRKSERALLSQH